MAKKVAEAKKETSKVEEVKVKPIVVKDDISSVETQKLEVEEVKKERDIDYIISEFVPVLTINNLLKIQVIEAIKEGKSKDEITFLLDSIDTFDKYRIELVKNLL